VLLSDYNARKPKIGLMDENTKAIVASNLTLAYFRAAANSETHGTFGIEPIEPMRREELVMEVYQRYLERLTPPTENVPLS
jgi:hypothetical protein